LAEALYQLEVKLPSGENGESKTQVINLKGAAQIWYSLRSQFPEIGNGELLYVATDEKQIYLWNSELGYVRTVVDISDIEQRVKALEENKVDSSVYEQHVHEFIATGVIKEEVIQEIDIETDNVNSVNEMARLDTSYSSDSQTLSLSWFAGTTQSHQVVKNAQVTKVTPTFEGSKSRTNEPYVDSAL
jgi:hypothetical protein